MTVTVTLTDAQAEAVAELIELAHRGREDFTYQAAHGDYTAEDITDAQRRWEAAQSAAAALTAQAEARAPHPVITAAEKWVKIARGMSTENIWEHFTCIEAEATATLASAAGRDDVAAMIRELHATTEDPDDDHYRQATAAAS